MNIEHFYKFFLILIFIFRNFTAVEVKIWEKKFTPDKFKVDVKNKNLTKNYFDFFQKIGLKENYKQIEGISQAIADVIDEFFIRQQIHFGVLIKNPLMLEYEEIIDKILSKDKEIQSFTEYSQSNIRLRFDPRKLKVLKILLKCNKLKKIKEIEKLKQDLLQKHVVDLYSYYICQRNKTTVDLITYEWFDVDSCNQQKIKILNSFDIKTQKWQKQLKNYEKFKRLNGCQIRTIEDPYVHENKEKKYLSEYGEFMHIVAEKANFTLKFINISNDEIDLYIFFGYSTQINEEYILTSPIWTINIGLMVIKGEKYTDYEKLLLPFDVTTWILLIGTFCLAFSLIFIINHANRKIQKIVFGDGVSMPTYNVVSTFFGVSLSKLPSSNFARFILINFICFCLIFRTAYQGVLFDYMNSDMRKPHALTFDEVFDNNYTILGYDIHIGWQFFESFDERRQKQIDMKTLTPGDFYQVCEYIKDDGTKTAIVTEEYFDLKVRGTCKQEIIRLKETKLTLNGGIAMEPFHYLYDVIEETMQWMLQAGILQYWYAYFHWYNYQRFHIQPSPPNKILSMSDLSYGFNIWLIVCGIAMVEFFFELIIGKITRKKKCQKTNDTEKTKIESPEDAKKNDLNEEESEFSEIIFESTEIKIEIQLLENNEDIQEEDEIIKIIFESAIDNLYNDSLINAATTKVKKFKQLKVEKKSQTKNEQEKKEEEINENSNEQQTNDEQSNFSKEINENSVELQMNKPKSSKEESNKNSIELKHPIENDLEIIDLIYDETKI